MGLLRDLFLGNGAFPSGAWDQIEAEGYVRVDQGLPGSRRYHRFRAPGTRSSARVQGDTFGLGISERRVLVFGSSGRRKHVDIEFHTPPAAALVVTHEAGTLALTVDLDRFGDPQRSGTFVIHAKTPDAPAIATELQARLREE